MRHGDNDAMDAELEPLFAALRPLAKAAEEVLMSDLSEAEANQSYEAIARQARPHLDALKQRGFNFFDMPHDCVLPAACDPWLG